MRPDARTDLELPLVRAGRRITWRRAARFLWFPLVAWLVWRVAQAITLHFVGGDPMWTVMWWDGQWYKWIFDHGYEFRPGTGLQQPVAFFPFLPWLTKGVEVIVGREGVAVGIVTTLGSMAAAVATYGVARLWRGERVARWAVVLMLAFPTSFFLWMFYTEAIFIAASAGAFWAYRRGYHGWAAVCAAVAVTTRVLGVVLVVVLVVVHVARTRGIDRVVGWYLLAVLAAVPVLVAQWLQAGDALGFVGAQEAWGRHMSVPWDPFVVHAGWVGDTRIGWYRWTALFELIAFGLAFAAAVFAAIPRRVRGWPAESWIWIFVMILPPLFTGIFVSMGRFVLAAWPMFVVGAYLVSRAPRAVGAAVVAAEFGFSVWMLDVLATGEFIA